MHQYAGTDIEVRKDGLPEGVRKLINLALAVPERKGARREASQESFLARVGASTIWRKVIYPKNLKFLTIGIMVFILILSACFGGGSKAPATKYYILNSFYSAEKKTPPVTDLKETMVAVGPISLTQMLDRPQIIIRNSHNEIRVTDLERWAILGENGKKVLLKQQSILHEPTAGNTSTEAVPILSGPPGAAFRWRIPQRKNFRVWI